MHYNVTLKRQTGFTMIELVIGMVVFAVAMVMLLSVIFPLASKTVDPIYQIRAVKLANSLLSEIQAKNYDENSTPSVGAGRCNEVVAVITCTPSSGFGAVEGESHQQFDDVDDYHGFTIAGTQLASSEKYQDLYFDFKLNVEVIYDGNYSGFDNNENSNAGDDIAVAVNMRAKLITIEVTTPNDEVLAFASYRSNF